MELISLNDHPDGGTLGMCRQVEKESFPQPICIEKISVILRCFLLYCKTWKVPYTLQP